MDVGCSGSLDTYSIIEEADYSFAELSCDIFSEEKDEDIPDLCDRIRDFKTRPLVWSGIEYEDIDLSEYDEEGGYVKNYLLELFARIDEVGGEYVVIRYNPDMNRNPEEYNEILNGISTLAGSYGLEIILLFSGKNEAELNKNFNYYKISENNHPFLRYGLDLENIEDYQVFFDNLEDMNNLKYFRIPAADTSLHTFRENLSLMADILADTDTYLCVWSHLDEITHKVMSNKYL